MSTTPPPPPPPPPPAGGPSGMAVGVPAEIGPRVIAALIDLIAIPIGINIIFTILANVQGIFGLIGFFAQWGYLLVYLPYMEGTTGQTIGKKTQNIKTVGLENGGQVLGFGGAFLRYFINYLPCGLGWLLPFVDAEKQTLGDKVAKGTVVQA